VIVNAFLLAVLLAQWWWGIFVPPLKLLDTVVAAEVATLLGWSFIAFPERMTVVIVSTRFIASKFLWEWQVLEYDESHPIVISQNNSLSRWIIRGTKHRWRRFTLPTEIFPTLPEMMKDALEVLHPDSPERVDRVLQVQPASSDTAE